MFNEQIGSDNYSDNKWTGIKDDLNIQLDLGTTPLVRTVSIGYLTDTNSWIFPPDKIAVRAGTRADQLTEVGLIDLPEQTEHENSVQRLNLEIIPGNYRYVAIDLINYGAAPAWHGEGKAGELWVFVDEIYLN